MRRRRQLRRALSRGAIVTVTLALLAGCASTATLQVATSQQQLPARVELVDTPFHPQTAHQCGPAALATVLAAAGVTADPASLADEVFLPGRAGSLQVEILAALRERQLVPYRIEPSLQSLVEELAAGRPVLVLQQIGLGGAGPWHYAVAIGYDAEEGVIVLRSGTTRRLELRAAAFDYTWSRSGRWGVLALRPDALPAGDDVDRYMAAAAQLEVAGHADAASQAYRGAARHWQHAALPWLGIGNLAAARGDWPEAERSYAEALRREPTDAASLNNRAEALAQLGCPAAALAALERGLAGLAADDPLRGELQRSYAALRDPSATVLRNETTHCSAASTAQ